jgi:hypothetical protein
MTDAPTKVTHLETPYVFIDTQALRQERLDWNGKHLARLRDLAKAREVIILTTNITKREIKGQIDDLLDETRKALTRNRTILDQLGQGTAVAAVLDADAAAKLYAAFEVFLADAKALDVPISISTEEMFDAYFNRRPPFSDKKKSEFPDAAVVAALQTWCSSRKVRAYVVSADPDMRACSATGTELIPVDTIAEILTRHAVSEEFLAALIATLDKNEYLSERLAEEVRDQEIKPYRSGWLVESVEASAKIKRVDGINIFDVEVVERDGGRLICEVGFEAEIAVEIEVEFEGEFGYHADDYQPPIGLRREKTLHRTFYAEVVIITLDPMAPEDIEFESIYSPSRPIELASEDIPSPPGYW